MSKAYVIEMDDEGASTYYIVDEATFRAAVAADDGAEGLMDWFPHDDLEDVPQFHSVKDLNAYFSENGIKLVDEIKGYFY